MPTANQQTGPQPSPKRLQYGVRGILLLLVFISLVFAAYRFGYDRGRQDTPIIPATLNSYQIHAREYDVADLVTSASDATDLIAGIRASAAQSSWDVVGGYATVDLADGHTSLAIEQTFSGHVSVVEYLSRVREHIDETGAKDIAQVIREIDDRE